MNEQRVSSNEADTIDSPNISRYGRTHKPKLENDFVSTDKKVSAYLKVSPGNQLKYFAHNEHKKKASPKKYERRYSPSSPRRGRPPKTPTKESSNSVDVFIKSEPQDPSSPVDGCEWMVGDLAWARVGGHPFWPCIIALDPVQKIFTKTVNKGRKGAPSQRWVHVQFFGDNGRRSWLNVTAVMSFQGREAFLQLGDTIIAGMRKKEPKQTSAFIIKPAVVQVWEKAVQEAEDMVKASREERVEFFNVHFPICPPKPPPTREELIREVMSQSPSTPKKRGRKRKAETSPSEEEVKKKQVKLEIEEEVKEQVDPLLTTTPRTIADRKKRQALLMQIARSNQPAGEPTSPISSLQLATNMHAVVKISPIKSSQESLSLGNSCLDLCKLDSIQDKLDERFEDIIQNITV